MITKCCSKCHTKYYTSSVSLNYVLCGKCNFVIRFTIIILIILITIVYVFINILLWLLHDIEYLLQLFDFIESHDLGEDSDYISMSAERVKTSLDKFAETRREAGAWLQAYSRTEWTRSFMAYRVLYQVSHKKEERSIFVTLIFESIAYFDVIR